MRPILATVLRIGAVTAIVATGLVVTNVAPAAAAPSWSIVPSPSPAGPTHGELDGIACTSTTNCLAAGKTAPYGPFGELTLGERWNGTSWVQVPTPDPTWDFGVGPASLSGVACAGASKCFAVGSGVGGSGGGPIIQRWNGSSWSYDVSPGSGSNASLNAVACVGASTCHAVGGDGTALMATRWNGLSWVAVAIRKPSGATGAFLSGVKCTSTTNCLAVGTYTVATATRTLAERWNGTAWSIVASPNPVGATSSSFSGVACPAPSTCYAVGSYTVAGTHQQRTLVEQWNGASWSIASSPNPAGRPVLSSVACSSVSSCMAVGTKGTSTLVERWNGKTWAIVPSPNPTGAHSSALHAVSCPTASACFAVGNGAFASGHTNDRMFAERWNGTAWNMQASPVKASVSPLHGVACASPTLCFAAGSYERISPPTTRAFLEQWNGTAWALVTTPAAKGATATELNDLACVSTTFCVAVGVATVGSQQTLVEQWDGSSWTVAPVAVAGSLVSVACADASSCTAVGTSGGHTLVEQWDGSSWTTASGAVSGSLSGVSCADASDCMAVGIINLPNSPVLQWDGSTWTAIDAAAPTASGNHDITPTSVSCTAPDDCMLVGNFRDFFDNPLTYAAHWDGAAWSQVDMELAPFGSGANDIACTSSTDCTAVGSHFPGHGGTQTWVEHWDGTSWAVVTSPDPAAESPPGSRLTSVTCTGAGECFAVGQWISDANIRTLIERFA